MVRPILEYIGKKVIDVGDDNAKGMSGPTPSKAVVANASGAALKLLGNGTLLGAIQLYAEMFALADKIGFDSAVFFELHRECRACV